MYNILPSAAFKWPKKLSRIPDEDGAFRRAALIAVMRVMAPRCVIAEDLASLDQGIVRWKTEFNDLFRRFESQVVRSDMPPDFMTMQPLMEMPAYRAMNAFFYADSGRSEVTPKPYGFSLHEVLPGESFLFNHVRAYSSRELKQEINENFNIEKAARKGEVNSCFASIYCYRYWWTIFNEAIFRLTSAYPQTFIENVKYLEKVDTDDVPIIGKTAIRIFPYYFKQTPSRSPCNTPDDLCTEWKTLSNGVVQAYTYGGPNKYTFFSADDIDFREVFGEMTFGGELEPRKGSGLLRKLWRDLAYEIGFTATNITDYYQESFRDAINDYWSGVTPPKYHTTGDMKGLLQLGIPWMGSALSWVDEFPYHGYAAMIAYLKYFEEYNNGYAISLDLHTDVDSSQKASHVVNTVTKSYRGTYNIQHSDLDGADISFTGGSFNIDASKLSWSTSTKSTSEVRIGPISSSYSVSLPSMSFAYYFPSDINIPLFSFWKISNEDGSDGGYYIEATEYSEYLFLQAGNGDIGDDGTVHIDAVDPVWRETLSRGVIEITYSSTLITATPDFNTPKLEEMLKSWVSLFELTPRHYKVRGNSEEEPFEEVFDAPVDLLTLPHIAPVGTSHTEKCKFLDENTYCFVKTSKSAAVKKLSHLDLKEQLQKEAGFPKEGSPSPIDCNGFEKEGKYEISVYPNEVPYSMHFAVGSEIKWSVYLPSSGEMIEVPPFDCIIEGESVFYKRDANTGEIIELDQGSAFVYSMGVAASASHIMGAEGSSLYGELGQEVKNGSSSLKVLKAISFVPPYKRNAIWGSEQESK